MLRLDISSISCLTICSSLLNNEWDLVCNLRKTQIDLNVEEFNRKKRGWAFILLLTLPSERKTLHLSSKIAYFSFVGSYESVSLWDAWPATVGIDECVYFYARYSWMWPQRIELCGSGSFLKSLALQDFLLQIRTLTSLICLSPGASLRWDTDFTCRAGLLLSLNCIL